MTVLFADGFEDGSAAWTLDGAALDTGRFGVGMRLVGTTDFFTTGFTPTVGPFIFGFAIKPTGAGMILILREPGTIHLAFSRGSGGEITVNRSLAGLLGSTAANVLPTGAWSYVEGRVVINNTTGSVVLRVNGVQVLNLTNVDTNSSGAYIDTIRFGWGTSSAFGLPASFDDVYFADTLGTVNNTFLGELTVEHLRPASDDTAQWLGSDGNSTNNWDLVNEAGTANTADYIASATVGQRDLYLPTPSARLAVSPVLAVVVTGVAQKTDAGTRTAKFIVKEGAGGTVRQSPDLGLPTTFGEIRAVFERKGDGSQFVVADVNALRFGVEVAT